MKQQTVLRLAVQKSGRLGDEALDLLKKAGLFWRADERRLSIQVENFPLEIIFLRNSDIIEMLRDDVADIAILGENTIQEENYSAEIRVTKDLGFGNCRLCLAVPKNSEIDLNGATIATSYPNILKSYLKKQKFSAKIIEMQGSVEVAPALQIADAICDLVSSGNTLRSHNLVEIETILFSSAQLVAKKGLAAEKTELFEKLLVRIDSVLSAKNLKSIVLNAPKKIIPEIIEVLPGLDSPTIMPLADEDWVAMHSVVTEDEQFWDTIQKLKALGASGILIQPIERVIV